MDSNMVSHIPDGSHSVGTYISVKNAAAALDWYQQYLNAEDRGRLTTPDGTIMHAEIAIEGSLVMLNEADADWGTAPPGELSTYTLCVYLPDCDSVFARCIEGGATELQPLADQFWGDRSGKLRDPFGVNWMLMTHIEDVSQEEMGKRFAAMLADG